VGLVDRQPDKLLKLIKTHDLEGLVLKRKDGQYNDRAKWFKVLNPSYTQKMGRRELFERN
jgi:ATP-dependent DNA ligase